MTDNRTADNWHFAQHDLANDELDRLRAEIERLRANALYWAEYESDTWRVMQAEIGRLQTENNLAYNRLAEADAEIERLNVLLQTRDIPGTKWPSSTIEQLRFERDSARAELHRAYAEIERLRTSDDTSDDRLLTKLGKDVPDVWFVYTVSFKVDATGKLWVDERRVTQASAQKP